MPRSTLTQLLQLLRSYRQYARSRQQLLQLDDWKLKDVGIGRAQAQREGHKPFWIRRSLRKAQPSSSHDHGLQESTLTPIQPTAARPGEWMNAFNSESERHSLTKVSKVA